MRRLILVATIAGVCGCGLVGDADDGASSIHTFVEVEMASGEVFEAPQIGVWAYHDVPPKRWGRHVDLTLNFNLIGEQRTFSMLVSIPPGFPDEHVFEARWSITPTQPYAWLRLNDREGHNVMVAESGTFAVKRSVEKDGAEYVQVTGTDLVFSSECGQSMTMSSFRGAFRVGEDDLLNKLTPELLEAVELIDEGSGDGSTIQIDGVRQNEGSVGLFLEDGPPGWVSYLATYPGCGTQLSGVFATLPYAPSSSLVRSSVRIIVSYDNPSAPDMFDEWATDQRVAYNVEHWPSGPGDYMTFELVGPVTVYKATIVGNSIELDVNDSRVLETLRITADLDADCRPGDCD